MNDITKTFVLMAAAGLSLPLAAAITIPQVPVVTYGIVRNEYGEPLTKAQALELKLVKDADRHGRVYAQCAVGASALLGMNYQLTLEIDSADGGRKNAVTTGTRMFIRATQGDVEKTLAPDSAFDTPKQGTTRRVDYTTGTDADNDGMPDAWEVWVLDTVGEDSSEEGIRAFRPDADADGDGMSNWEEYLAGTDPFNETDLVKITGFELVPGTQRAKVTFMTSYQRKFRLVFATSLAKPDWSPLAASESVDGELKYAVGDGDGFERTFYVDARMPSAFIRLAVN